MTDRFNRVLFLLLGIVLVAAGVVGLLAENVLRLDQPSTLYDNAVEQVLARPALWLSLIALGGILLFLLGLWLLRAQLRRPGGPGVGRVTLDRSGRGNTTVQSVAVARAAARDLRRLPGVTDSSARLASVGDRPQLQARLDVPPDADLVKVRRDAEPVYDRVARSLGVSGVEADVRLRPLAQPPEPPRVS